MNVAFAGIGRMGLPMARNLLAAGFPLSVWNRTASRCAELAAEGARVAASPRRLAEGADVVVTMLADAAAAEAVLRGDDGIFAGLEPGAVVVDMSTIGPVAARALADEAGSRGIHFLDAPVSGSVSSAEQAALVAMVGGEPEAFERARPVLAAMTKAQFHLGPAGAGAAMKLAVNSVIAVTNESIAEALVFAERSGIERPAAYEVLASGAVASPFVLYKRNAFLNPDSEPVAFTTTLMRKDVRLALEVARSLGVRLAAAEAAGEVLERACAAGYGDADFSRVADVIRLGPPSSRDGNHEGGHR